MTAKVFIDESHFEVQRLQEAGYSLKESISAIQCYGSASAAVDYLMSAESEESEEFFQSSLVLGHSSAGEQARNVVSLRYAHYFIVCTYRHTPHDLMLFPTPEKS